MSATKTKKPPEDLVEIFTEEDVPQRSPDWFELRRGIPTTSKFGVIMAEGKDGGESITREKYMNMLAGEILTGEVAETFRNEAMDRGNIMEPEALEWYERTNFVDLERVGFVRRTVRPTGLGDGYIVGCSPDARLPKQRKIIEVKTLRPDLLIDVVRRGAGGFPLKHRAQCQGGMWVCGADTCDLILYHRGWKSPPKFTIDRDDVYIKQLSEQVEKFVYELRMLVKEVKSKGRGW